MHPIAFIDCISVMASAAALVFLFLGWKRSFPRDVKLVFLGLLIFAFAYNLCLFLEWSGVTTALDTLEDFIGALLPMWWAFVFYALLQEMAGRDLRQSEERLKSTLDALPTGIMAIDPETHVIADVNPVAVDMFGAPKEEIIGRRCHQYICPAEEGRCPITDLKQKVDESERFLITADGTKTPILKTVVPVTLGGREHLLESFVDITHRKRAEDAMRASEEKYRSLVESTEDSVYLVSSEYRYLFMNEKHLSRFSLPEERVLGRTYGEFHSEKETKTFMEKVNRVIQTGKSLWHEYRSERDKRYFLRTLSPVKDAQGRCVAVTVISKDITELKEAENSLQAERERLYSLLDGLPALVCLIGSNHSIRFANHYFREHFGVPGNRPCYEVLGRRSKPCKGCRTFEVFETNASTEWEWTSPDDRVYRVYDYPFTDVDGSPLVLELAIDITERKRLEAQLQQAQRIEAIGTLAGGIAHDFNNVLMGIQGYTSLLSVLGNLPPPMSEHLQRIEEMVERGAELTRQLLGFARGGKYEVKPTNLNELIASTSEMFGRTRREIKTHQKYQDEIWPVDVDQGQFEQVLLNLYVNAWQAMPQGGDLYVETKNVVLDESYTTPFGLKPGRYVRVSVRDTGIGMDERTKQRVFDPFFTTKEMARGTGLGLSSAYGIVKNHGGMININSEKGQGSTFNVYLPASQKEVAAKRKERVEEILMGSETILLVDDEDRVLDVGKEMLEAMGYKVFLASHGREALELYAREKDKIDLVILDMIMPHIGGGEAFDSLKEENPRVKVLLSSGYSIDGQATEILERGCDGFIQKPFSMIDLSVKVREILDQ